VPGTEETEQTEEEGVMGITSFVKGAIAGAAVAYLFDPEAGRGRRARLRDQAAAAGRRARDRAGEMSRHAGNVVEGRIHEATASMDTGRAMDDVTVADRIRSEVLGRPDLAAGGLLVDVTDGVAHLRGRFDDADRLARVIDLTEKVRGVREVDNLVEVD
jgi:osmotically-inducible protein OsmY